MTFGNCAQGGHIIYSRPKKWKSTPIPIDDKIADFVALKIKQPH